MPIILYMLLDRGGAARGHMPSVGELIVSPYREENEASSREINNLFAIFHI